MIHLSKMEFVLSSRITALTLISHTRQNWRNIFLRQQLIHSTRGLINNSNHVTCFQHKQLKQRIATSRSRTIDKGNAKKLRIHCMIPIWSNDLSNQWKETFENSLFTSFRFECNPVWVDLNTVYWLWSLFDWDVMQWM